ncbi:T9SS type A sorting domain-containing protein [Brumimicrobium glaciale]|uniref:T9SS type A sorting domain-containing protein n=1 Tax=Brumimicrobium glaciale TaxID=200475 RepID=A0A4Q4KN11_9FLAO|nr:PCMD domain-containing protein [Brumimicrobium glaciale]RYM33794.1 T9SS type A sorting domain-containing protein [Brumimicrobium glaciale]
MKNSLLIISAVLLANISISQQQLQNPGFENWDDVGTATAEPSNWSSLKTADALASFAPNVLTEISGRTGDYAIELEVKSQAGIQANGIITNGRVHADFTPSNGYVFTDAGNQKWNTAFSSRPDSLVGWYKYAPVAGDSGKIEIILHSGTSARLPRNATTIANEVGSVRYNFTTPQTQWTRFSQPFKYLSTNISQYILTTIAAGDSTISKAGTKLAIDDLELIYNPLGIDAYSKQDIAVNGSKGFLYFDVENQSKVTYQVADVTGKVIQSGNAHAKTPFYHDSGIYFILIQTENEIFTKKLYIQQ